MLLDNLNVYLLKTRFPENIGMAARACANMDCGSLALIDPERWDIKKALPLATAKGVPILDNLRIYPDIESAISNCHMLFGSTARLGGWRKSVISPWDAAQKISESLLQNYQVGLLFGPEDRGLNNAEILYCNHLVHIPASSGSGSLNLAQAVLIILYECAKNMRKCNAIKSPNSYKGRCAQISLTEYQILEKELKNILQDLDCAHGKNSDYYFIQWQNLLRRARIQRHEFDALMGFCRQIRNKIDL